MPKAPEAPIVFFLRVPPEDNSVEPAEAPTYSDILNTVEASQVSERFSHDLMKQILEKTKVPVYGASTACFHCCHSFSWRPTALPIHYDTFDKTYVCEGHYCSPECALAHLYEMPRLSDASRWNRHSLLMDLYRPLIKERELIPAPPRTTLRMFGGPLDIAQFRESLTTAEAAVQVELPPIRLHMPSMNLQGPMRDVKKFVSLSSETVEKATSELRLKRSRPIHGNTLTIDRCIGKV